MRTNLTLNFLPKKRFFTKEISDEHIVGVVKDIIKLRNYLWLNTTANKHNVSLYSDVDNNALCFFNSLVYYCITNREC